MSDLDQKAILDFAAALAHNLAADYVQRADLPFLSDEWLRSYEQQYLGVLAPGLVVFVSRLSAALPAEFDLHAVLAQFFADPATAAALNHYGQDTAAGTAELAAGLERAGLPPGAIGQAELGEALAAWNAAGIEVARQNGAGLNYQQTAANTPLYSVQQPPANEALQAAMADLVRALAMQGLSHIDNGDVLANDGYSILFSWRRGQRGEREPVGESSMGEEPATTGAEPPDGVQENLNGGSGSLDVISGGGSGVTTIPETSPSPGPVATPVAPDVLRLRLDTAAPPQVTVGIPFDLAAAIRLVDSPPLVIDDLSLHESTAFAALLPAGTSSLSLRIQIAAPDCDVIGGDTRPVRLLAGQDGPTVYFQLTPRRAGPLSIIVTVYQETDWVGSTRLRTEVAGGAATGRPTPDVARGAVALTVQSRPLSAGEVNRQVLRDALANGYNLDELRELCFDLEIDYDDLPGDSKSAKARELVMYCQRRNLLATLVERVMRDRPHLLVAG